MYSQVSSPPLSTLLVLLVPAPVRLEMSFGPKAGAVLLKDTLAVQQSIGVPKGRDAGLGYLRGLVEEAKASGLVARAIDKTGARGVSVAPRAG